MQSPDTIMLFGHNMAETQAVTWMRILDRLEGPNPPELVGLLRTIVAYGQYVVLAFLLIEVSVFLYDQIRSGPLAAKPKA